MTTRSIPWPRILAEGVVIIGSILLALAADAWWDGRQDRTEEAALLRSLSAEIRVNLDSLDLWRDTLGVTRDRSRELLQLTGPEAQPIEAGRFISLVYTASSTRTYHPSTGAISAVLGRLSLIRSEELRQEVAGFEERLRDLQENFDWSMEEVGDLLALVQDEVPLYTGESPAWAEATPSVDTRSLLRDVEFANLLGLWIWRVEKMSTEASNLHAYLSRMLALIEADTT